MNACNNLPLYLYGELDAHNKKLFEEHLSSCKECAQSLLIFKEVKEHKKAYAAPARVIDAVFEKTTRKTPLFIFSKPFKAGFALAACFLILFLAMPGMKNAPAGNLYYADASIEEIMAISSELDEFESDFMFYA